MYHSVIDNPDESILYYDICSLYPFILKYGNLPSSDKYEIIFENFQDINKYQYGVVQCNILPPKTLYIPILPHKIKNKLIFTLCFRCAADNRQGSYICDHSDSQRLLSGIWILPEILLALKHGYKILEIHCIIHWITGSV